MELSSQELRVLGCLIEKAFTTPEHYPLTTNALVNACNQKSSRDPVVAYSEKEVDHVMQLLREASLARTVRGSGMRTHKHKHCFDEATGLSGQDLAVLAVLMLRGSQSAGELKTRTERYAQFDDVAQVGQTLQALAQQSEPLVRNVGRQSGQGQDRWSHLLSDGLAPEPESVVAPATPVAEKEPSAIQQMEERISQLENRLGELEVSLGLGEEAAPT